MRPKWLFYSISIDSYDISKIDNFYNKIFLAYLTCHKVENNSPRNWRMLYYSRLFSHLNNKYFIPFDSYGILKINFYCKNFLIFFNCHKVENNSPKKW